MSNRHFRYQNGDSEVKFLIGLVSKNIINVKPSSYQAFIKSYERDDMDLISILYQCLPESPKLKMILFPFFIFLQRNVFDKLEFDLVETSVKVSPDNPPVLCLLFSQR